MRAIAAVMVIAVAALASCSSTEPAPAPDLPRDMAGKVTADGMYTHLRKLQEIADANRGNRAEGTPGYDASVDYVVKVLKDKGFDVQTPEFDRLERTEGGNPTLTVSGRGYHVDQASLLVATPPGGLNAITLRPQKAPGCTAADYGTVSVKGAIAVVDDTGCSVGRQAEHRDRKGRRRVACRQCARHRRQPCGSVHVGLLPAAHRSGRCDRQRRRRGAASHQRTGAAGAGQQARHGENTKRGGADQVRRHEESSCWRARISTALRAAPASTTTGRGWRHCWKRRRRWARNPRSPTPSGSSFWGSEAEGSTKYVARTGP